MRRHFLAGLLVGFWALGPVLLGPSTAAAKKRGGPVPIGVSQAKELAPESKFNLPGTVLPWAESHLAAEIDGRVEKIFVHEGQWVKKGDPLVQLRILPLQLELELAAAEKKRVATLLEELLTGNRTETIQAARYAMVQAEARLKLAQSELKRIKNLYQQGVVSLDAFDKGQTEADAALAELQEKTEIFKELKAGPRKERIHQEEANLEAAEARMRINQDNIDRATLRAPFDGIVVKKETEIGEWLEQGDPAASLMAIRPVKVEIHLPQALFSLVRMGTKARVILPSPDRPRDGKVFKAKVIEKVASGDPGSRTFPVRLKVQRPKNFLAPGMLVQVELQPGGDKKKLLYVPKDALVRTAKDTSVWVVRQDDKNGSTVARVTVIPGRSMNHWVAIGIKKKQIRPGDWVVVQGNERLKPGARVKIVKRLP